MNWIFKYRTAFLSLFILVVCALQGQPYWAKDIGGTGNDHVADVKTDDAGNIYATGEFSGVISFGGAQYTATAGIDMFLTKMTPTGQVLWFVQGGGPGIDRGIKLAVRDDHVAVVGEFTQTATFQSQSLTSSGGPDIFIAMHNAASGALEWIAQGGGPSASDRPYGVAISASGNVTVVGEFSGAANIGGTPLISMQDPQTLLPSIDVFIASYAPAGSPLWTRQGAAKYTDRAIDVVNDPADNIYVTGQFSDTIQFATSHPNAMYNATFLLKLDAAGNEVWFRRVGGAVYDEVRDMQWTSAGDLLMVGDLRGTMIFLDSVPDLIPSGDPYAYYLLRVGSNGELLADTVIGSQNPVSGRSVDERNGTITVLGQFDCQFTSRVGSAHAGLWMATGEQDLFIVRHALDDWAVLDAQQFGGRQEKLAGQVATLLDGSPIFSGSYEDVIVFPCLDQFTADIASNISPYGLMAPNMGGYCGDAYYGSYAADTSNGLKDGFIARGYVIGRAPYDWWSRNDTLCSFLPQELCLGLGAMAYDCPDSINACGEAVIGIHPEFSFSIYQHTFYIGPDLDFSWSTGETTDSLAVSATGMYSVICTSTSGCVQWTDSVHVTIHDFPPQPLISDDIPVGTDSPDAYSITICDPEQTWLWCSNVDTTLNFYWSGLGDQVHADSLLVDTSGTFYFHMVDPFGCSSYNTVYVTDKGNPTMGNFTVSLEMSYPQDTDQNDTLDLCPNAGRLIQITPTWYLDGAPYTFTGTDLTSFYFGYTHDQDTTYISEPTAPWSVPVYSSGWYVDHVSAFIYTNACVPDTLFLPPVVSDSIYVHLYTAVNIDLTLTGPAFLCPSDTAHLEAVCTTCTGLNWSGPGLFGIDGNNAYTTTSGYYEVVGYAADTNGCSFQAYADIQLTHPGVPELDVAPIDGVICPDSSATIFTEAVGQYTWYGPYGELAVNNDSIAVTTPGEYYLALVDPNGCYLNSDPILITGYATPFLNVLPDGVLCLGETDVLLQVVTTGFTSLVWAAPLSGNAVSQTVDQPGVYSCTVQACGITTELSTVIVTGSAHAEVLDAGPLVLCPGATLTLEAVVGQAAYIWQPGAVFGSSLLVSQPGAYTLVALDANGCSDTTEAVVVTAHDFDGPLTIQNITVCVGSPVILQETAAGTFHWYSDINLTVLLGTGPTLDLGVPADSTVVYLVRSDAVCGGLPFPVQVDVVAPPQAVIQSAPASACAGAVVLLVADVPAPFTAVWDTPSGNMQGDPLYVGPVTVTDGGWYVLTAVSSGCVGLGDSVLLAFVEPVLIDLGPDTVMCSGSQFQLFMPSGFSDPVWSTGEGSSSIVVSGSGTYGLEAMDMNGCHSSATVQVGEEECPSELPNVITPNGDGVNDGFALGATGAVRGELEIYDRWGALVHTGDPIGSVWRGTRDGTGELVLQGTYYYVVRVWNDEGVPRQLNGTISVLR
ncbi:MAG: gliding motility-associated C-terminal domain-containing protein [Flavobacteriales bacterium]|nr:gliding motility-associated C-terminal domain-containing protein [Flavobacteriales bacterium]